MPETTKGNVAMLEAPSEPTLERVRRETNAAGSRRARRPTASRRPGTSCWQRAQVRRAASWFWAKSSRVKTRRSYGRSWMGSRSFGSRRISRQRRRKARRSSLRSGHTHSRESVLLHTGFKQRVCKAKIYFPSWTVGFPEQLRGPNHEDCPLPRAPAPGRCTGQTVAQAAKAPELWMAGCSQLTHPAKERLT